VVAAIRAYNWSEKSMPVDGGFLDQSASWVAFCGIFESERQKIMEEERKAEESARRAKTKGRAR
jgi:hypothetical protein